MQIEAGRSGPAECVERLKARRCLSATQHQVGTNTAVRLCHQMFIEFECFVHTNVRRSIVLHQTVQGHQQCIRSRASCTASSFLCADPVDLPSRSLAHCGSEAGCCWVPMKGGAAQAKGGCRLASPVGGSCVWSRLQTFGYLTENDR